jgi:signal transduction histidine kinase
VLETAGGGRLDRRRRAAGTAGRQVSDEVVQGAALGIGAFAVTLGAPLVVIAATGDHLEYPLAAAALRAGWIGLYAVAGLYFARTRANRRLGLIMTTIAAVTAIASTDVLPGQAAYTVSRIAVAAVVPLMMLMFISVPEARAAWQRAGGLILLSIPVVLALCTAHLMFTAEVPWGQAGSQCADTCAGSGIQVADAPGVAHGIAVAVAIVLIAVLAGTVVALFREIRTASPITGRALRWIGWFLAIWSAPLAVGLAASAIDPEPARLGPYLVSTGIVRCMLPFAMLAVVLGRAARTGAMRNELTARLAHADEPAEVERAISDVLGDPTLRLAFRHGSEWIDVDGGVIGHDAPQEKLGWVHLDEEHSVALVFDPALTAQEDRMHVVARLGAVALERTRTSAELRAMRRRLVEVAEQERQRIERNLHDGAQQRLIGMTIRIAMARETIESHPELALSILREFGADVQRALDELRDLAHGLYPAVLVDHGLADALRAAARHSPVPVDVAISPIGRLAPETEAAVYFCCAEALQNAVKHGGPQPRISMGLWHEEDGALAFEVTDDGPGFAVGPVRPGTGLMGMADRVESVGGTLSIDSAPGRGTRVGGRIPVGHLQPGRVDV